MKWCMRGMIVLLLMLPAGLVQAVDGVELERLGFGLGFGSAEVSEYSTVKTVLQGYVAYRTDGMYGLGSDHYSVSAELGYIDVSDAKRDGVWLTPVVAYHVTDLSDVLVRAGFEYGDDIGGVYGVGVTWQLEHDMAMRLEYVEHPHASVVLLNVIYYPWSWPF